MMIGEYIHRYYGNYLKYGLGYNEKGTGENNITADALKEMARSRLKSLSTALSASNTDALRELVMLMQGQLDYWKMGTAGSNPVLNSSDKLKQEVEAEFKRQANARATSYRVDPNTLDIVSNNSGSPGSQIKNTKTISYKKLISQWKILQKTYEKLFGINASNTSPMTVKTLRSQINNRMNQLVQEYNQAYLKDNNLKIQIVKGENIDSLIQNMNALSGIFKQLLPSVSTIKGAMGEYFAKRVVEEAIHGTFLNSVQGFTNIFQQMGAKVNTNFGQTKNAFSNNFLTISGEGFTIKGGSTKGKTDLQIVLQGEESPLNVSIKNMGAKSTGSIKILEGTSVLQLLQSEDRFLNHWLNISPIRGGATDTVGKKGVKGSQITRDASASEKKKANMGMKFLIIAYALTGGNYRVNIGTNTSSAYNTAANAFIVQAGGKVYGISMNGLLNYFSGIQEIPGSVFSGGSFDSFKNIYTGGRASREGANQRIIKMLNQLHQQKMRVTIPFSLIKNANPVMAI